MANSFKDTNTRGVVELMGLSADIADLPTNVATGSTAYCVDTKKLYIFEETTGEWYEQ